MTVTRGFLDPHSLRYAVRNRGDLWIPTMSAATWQGNFRSCRDNGYADRETAECLRAGFGFGFGN